MTNNNTKGKTMRMVLVLGLGGIGGATRRIVKRLTVVEFQNYKLQNNEEFDFSQFKTLNRG
jgi:hypothetical protein